MEGTMTIRQWSSSVTTEDDKSLLKRIRTGDKSAFSIVFNKYQRKLLTYLINFSNNEDLSKDAAQEAFLTLIKKPPLFVSGNSLKAWLFKTARNKLIDALRRSNKLAGDEPLELESCTNSSPDDKLLHSDDLLHLKTVVDQLPALYREVVVLHHFSELSFREICKVIKIPMGTALWRMQKALSIIRESYELPQGEINER